MGSNSFWVGYAHPRPPVAPPLTTIEPDTSSSSDMPPKSKLSSIPSLHEFNPDTSTWTSYRDRMGFYFDANGIELATDRKALFLWAVGDQVYGLLESLVAPRLLTEAELSFKEIITLLDKHFDDTKNIMTCTYSFFSCYQKHGQSFTEWKAELYEKARRCGFTTSVLANKPIDRAIRDMFVIGVRNPKIRQALLKAEDPDLQTAEKLILAAERLEEDVRRFSHPLKENDSHVDKIHNKQFKPNKPNYIRPRTETADRTIVSTITVILNRTIWIETVISIHVQHVVRRITYDPLASFVIMFATSVIEKDIWKRCVNRNTMIQSQRNTSRQCQS